MDASEVRIRRIRPHEGAPYRALRLGALADAPSAFGSTLAEASARPAAWWDARAVEAAEGDAGAIFLADCRDGLCGLVGTVLDEGESGDAGVVSMWVEPSLRRTGLGRALLDAAAAWATAQGAAGLRLWVTEGNVPATALYEAYGFAFTGEEQPHPSQPGLRELAMRRDLPPSNERAAAG